MTAKLPRASADLIPGKGPMAREFYLFMQSLEQLQAGNASADDISALTTQIQALQSQINELPIPLPLRALSPLMITQESDSRVLKFLGSQSSSGGRSIPQSWVFA
jgi:hypothetical protein